MSVFFGWDAFAGLTMWEDSEVWILGVWLVLVVSVARFLDGGDVVVGFCEEIVDDATSTFPSLAVKMSSSSSCVKSGKRDSRSVSFRSVDSSSSAEVDAGVEA